MLAIREYREGDSISEITSLVNRAYARLADAGMKFVGSWQTEEMTLDRIHWGTCLLAIDGDRIVGTVILYDRQEETACAYYRKPGVRYFGKFAVEPSRQGESIGKQLYLAIEDLARNSGATEIACDTAEQAEHLIAMYRRWGFEVVQRMDWSITNYISVVLAKRL